MKILLPHFFRAPWAWGVEIAMAQKNGRSTNEALFNCIKLTMAEILPDAINPVNDLDWDDLTNRPTFDGVSFIQNRIPTTARPIADVVANQDFKGSRVYREPIRNQRYIPYAHWNKRGTAEWAQASSDVLLRLFGGDTEIQDTRKGSSDSYVIQPLGIFQTPGAIEHIVTSYTGGTGKFISDATKLTLNTFRHFETGEAIDPVNIPVYNRLTKQYDEDKTFLRDYYNILEWQRSYEHSINANHKAFVRKDGSRNEQAVKNFQELSRSERNAINRKVDALNREVRKLEQITEQYYLSESQDKGLKKTRTKLMKKVAGMKKELDEYRK